MNGEVTIDPLNTGSYNVEENQKEGYKLLSAECTSGSQDGETVYGVEVTTNETVTCTFINTRERGTVNVTKYHDLNANGISDEGEELLADWTINLNEDSEVTGEDGEVTFNPVTGEYELSEDLPEGWIQSNIACSLDEEGIGTYSEESKSLALTVGADQVINCEIGNYQNGEIIVTKYSDDNGNGIWDEGEKALGGWEMNLEQGESLEEQTTSEENGQTTFNDLTPGTYVLSEDQKEGWALTGISCDIEEPNPTVTPTVTPTPEVFTGGLCHWNEGADKWNALAVETDNPGHINHELDFPYEGPREENGHPDNKTGDDWCAENDPNLRSETLGLVDQVEAAVIDTIDEPIDTKKVEVTSGQTVNCEVGNQPLIPELTIAKRNDTGGAPRVPGDVVTFTLTIKVSESDAESVEVIDVPSEGFQYVGGSWTALKNGLPFIIPEPTYASPGTWSLGDLLNGDEVVLTYQAKVAATQDTGVYPDLAWSEGQSLGGEQVLALAQPEGYIDENFVGTEVEILADNYIGDSLDIRREEKREEGKVLGAATLPATGSATILALAALLMVVAGAGGVAYGLRLKKKEKLILL
ncbi:MAG: Serine-aspartate repeat-containing protein F precursor [Microgenomates bacterium OLB23]|nr:MAG: Serine-aspartate repeat-containing protein F precursor [Microgenomates bacterium OLB23]